MEKWIKLFYALTILIISANGLSSIDERVGRKLFGGYRITPKFCKASKTLPRNDPRSHGPTICMFNHECTQRQGEVVGACMDGFLFGACCQLPGTVETPLIDPQLHHPSNSAAAQSYESYGNQQTNNFNQIKIEQIANHRPHVPIQNNYYETIDVESSIGSNVQNNNILITEGDPNSNQFYVNKNSVTVSSASPEHPVTLPSTTTSTTLKNTYTYPSSTSVQQPVSHELPTHIPTGPSSIDSFSSTGYTVDEMNHIAETLLNDPNAQFGHSDITHSVADSDLIETDQMIESSSQNYYGISSTENLNKVTFGKPMFRPKPKPTGATSDPDKYVLIQTVTNKKPDVIQSQSNTVPPVTKPQGTMSHNDMEAIESIILMLNDTKTGPQYNTGSTMDGSSTTSLDYDKYGSSSFYVTADLPSTSKSPMASTSYVYSAHPTKRPIQNEQPTTDNKVYLTSVKESVERDKPQTSPTPPSTSYVTGSTTVRPKKPSTSKPLTTPTIRVTTESLTTTPKPITSPTPTIILLGPYGNKYSTVATKTSERPSPTVHITPKPTVNLITSSSWTQKPMITGPPRLPSTSYIYSPTSITKRPTIYLGTSTPQYNIEFESSPTPSHHPPISNDFDDPGYYGISPSSTHHPDYRPIIQQTVNSESYYGVIDESNNNLVNQQPGYAPGYFHISTSSFNDVPVEMSTIKEEYYTSPIDLNNFPPVRNPNLNMSATFGSGVTIDDYDISTPTFVEDETLNNKMGLLVSKIVAALQENFDDLAGVVYDTKNSTVTKPIVPTKRPVTGTTKRPIRLTTKKPSVRPGGTQARPTVSRPTVTGAVRPTTKRPVGGTTKRPTSGTNTKRPTRKPSTVLTTKRPQTVKPVIKVTTTTTTKRPTPTPPKKVIQTTTEENIENDEEDNDNEDEDVGEETNDHTTEFDRSKIQCGVRPQVKTGRIVGGKGSTFGEFPWQVLVRESTWLGLFTKNKCGGVLITKNYVMTAAHCQPGFLASLVTVFGEFDISGDLETKRSVTKNVKRVVVHREYDAGTFENDLALLELESPIHYDTHIVPICMPSDTADFTGRMATVTGWGRLKYGGGVPSILQEVQVPIIENSVCQEMFHTAGHNKKILNSFLCAGYANGQKDSCEGDSGGPLVLQRTDGRWQLAGTVSHGIKCAAPYLPGVYMRTTFYKPWLRSVTGVH